MFKSSKLFSSFYIGPIAPAAAVTKAFLQVNIIRREKQIELKLQRLETIGLKNCQYSHDFNYV